MFLSSYKKGNEYLCKPQFSLYKLVFSRVLFDGLTMMSSLYLDLKFCLSDWKSEESNLQPLVNEARRLSTASQPLLTFSESSYIFFFFFNHKVPYSMQTV